eukprot:g3262.t1 g3262   contig12:1732805-1733074(-)
MQVIVTAPTGASSAYAVEGATTVSDLKAMIENQEFIPGHLIRLVAGDSELTGGTLAGNGIEEDEELSSFGDSRRYACQVEEEEDETSPS